jgi:hypothetical protein
LASHHQHQDVFIVRLDNFNGYALRHGSAATLAAASADAAGDDRGVIGCACTRRKAGVDIDRA